MRSICGGDRINRDRPDKTEIRQAIYHSNCVAADMEFVMQVEWWLE